MADNALTKLSLGGQLGVSVAAAVVIGVAFYYGYFSAAREEENTKSAKLEGLRQEIRQLEVTANKLQDAQRGHQPRLLPGMADQHGRRRQLPQPGDVLRPRQPPLAAGEHREPQDRQ